jgi:threonine dehydrogenase-like Zn-dependent dehydrogenase
VSAKALQFVEPGKVRLIETEFRPPGPGELAVRMLASSTCNHSELRSFHGGTPAGYGSRYPMAPGEPGHEGVGEVTAVGDDATDFGVGDIVAMTGMGGEPTHRSGVLRLADTVARIHPRGRDPKAASILEMFGCAYHCIRVGWERRGGYDNARVAVIGAGAIGLCSLQILRYWPAQSVVALDVDGTKLELASRLGAVETTLVTRGTEPEELARKLGRFDVVVECTGQVSGHLLANALRPRVIINVSYCPEPYPVHQGRWFASNTTVYNPGVLSSDELRAVANLYNRGLIDPDAMISRRIPPNPEAYLDVIRATERGEIVKAVVDWEDEG